MGVYLKEPVRVPQTEVGYGPNFEYAATSCQGWRNTQEDVHLVMPQFDRDTALFAVFDGHNGAEVSNYVSKYLPEYIRRNRNYRQGRIAVGLKEAFLLLDKSIVSRDGIAELRELRAALHPDHPEFRPGFSSGTTAVVCLFRPKSTGFHVANIGDSRCVLCRDGRPLPLSQDSKPDDAGEMARIERAGGTVAKGRINMQINVSRAFGDHMFKGNPELNMLNQMMIALPDVVEEPFHEQTDQFMVLMCDGIWNSIPNDDLIAFIGGRLQRHQRLAQITEEIVARVLPANLPETGVKGKDNMTIILVRFRR